MTRHLSLFSFFIAVLGLSSSPGLLAAPQKPTAILVNKKDHALTVVEYQNGAYHTLKSFHATLGRVLGDKQEEGDLKTPEGIYFFNMYLTPPGLKPKFGVMAFHMAYPNPYDRIAGRTGSAVMLHATNEPERLKKDYDSEGCVVVNNHELQEIKPFVRLGLTPILIFEDLTPEYMEPGKDPKLQQFFDGWVKGWESREIEPYIKHYHSQFSAQGKDKAAWKSYKAGLIKNYAEIQVNPKHVLFFKHPKYSVVQFNQNYYSRLKNGRTGHKSSGTKTLYVAEEDGQFKIVDESYTPQSW
ncbi:MAG: murein L,D-transpeptidase family protein [Bacteriovoracia bacterium]